MAAKSTIIDRLTALYKRRSKNKNLTGNFASEELDDESLEALRSAMLQSVTEGDNSTSGISNAERLLASAWNKLSGGLSTGTFGADRYLEQLNRLPQQKFQGKVTLHDFGANELHDERSLCYLAIKLSCAVVRKEIDQNDKWLERDLSNPGPYSLRVLLRHLAISDEKYLVVAIAGDAVLEDRLLNAISTDEGDKVSMSGRFWRKAFHDNAMGISKNVVEAIKTFKLRNSVSLLLTGHAIGGAIAQCLFESRLQEGTELNRLVLKNGYKYVHCVTFGTPRVATAASPTNTAPRTTIRKITGRQSVIPTSGVVLSYINEGDLIANDREGYIKSLIKATDLTEMQKSSVELPVPCFRFLGTVILLRDPRPDGLSKGIAYEACDVESDQLNQVLFGDPRAHEIKDYYLRYLHAALPLKWKQLSRRETTPITY